jgi:twinkle protein
MNTFYDYGILNINTKIGGQQRTLCPQCSHTRNNHKSEKCLSVDTDNLTWFCHHCNWTGKISENKIKYKEIDKYKSIPYEKNENINNIEIFFKNRGINKEIIERNKISEHNGWVMFPYYINEDCVNVKYRNIKEKKFMQSKEGFPCFYKINDIINQNYAVICEGEIDALSFEVAGILQAVSVPNGGINPEAKNISQKLKFIDNSIHYFDDCETIYLATDSDAVGRRLCEELSRRFGKERCRIVRFPEGCKDANDVLLKQGTAGLYKCLTDAEPYPIENVNYAKDFESNLIDIWNNGFNTGVKTNSFQKFDEHFTFHEGQLTVITGIPSHGKSNFIDNIIVELAKNVGWKSAVFSPENPSIEIWLIRLMEIYLKRPFYSGIDRMNPDLIKESLNFLNDFIFNILPEDNFQLDNVLATAKMLLKRYGINILVIDPFNNLETNITRGESETSFIAKILVKLRNYARKTGIHIILIAHPRKMNKINGSNYNFEVPVLYDISGSANFYNIADNGGCVYRRFDEDDASKSHMEFYWQKIKSKYIGKLGRIDFEYDLQNQSYKELNIAQF